MVYLIYFRSGLVLCQYGNRINGWMILRPASRTGFYKRVGKRTIKKIVNTSLYHLYPSQLDEEKILNILVVQSGYKREDIIRVLGVQLR